MSPAPAVGWGDQSPGVRARHPRYLSWGITTLWDFETTY